MPRTKTPGGVQAKPLKRGKGRPSLYDPLRSPRMAEAICAEFGADNKQLARALGVSGTTLDNWIQAHPEFKQAVLRGKDTFDTANVEKSLLRRALGYDYIERKVRREPIIDNLGNKTGRVKTVKETKTMHVQPDVSACRFWLRNRNSVRWPDSKEIRGNMYHHHEHEVDLDKYTDEELRILRSLVAKEAGVESGYSQ